MTRGEAGLKRVCFPIPSDFIGGVVRKLQRWKRIGTCESVFAFGPIIISCSDTAGLPYQWEDQRLFPFFCVALVSRELSIATHCGLGVDCVDVWDDEYVRINHNRVGVKLQSEMDYTAKICWYPQSL